jgi:hypothetical protein
VCLLHVSDHLWPSWGRCTTKDILQKLFETLHNCKIHSFEVMNECYTFSLWLSSTHKFSLPIHCRNMEQWIINTGLWTGSESSCGSEYRSQGTCHQYSPSFWLLGCTKVSAKPAVFQSINPLFTLRFSSIIQRYEFETSLWSNWSFGQWHFF